MNGIQCLFFDPTLGRDKKTCPSLELPGLCPHQTSELTYAGSFGPFWFSLDASPTGKGLVSRKESPCLQDTFCESIPFNYLPKNLRELVG